MNPKEPTVPTPPRKPSLKTVVSTIPVVKPGDVVPEPSPLLKPIPKADDVTVLSHPISVKLGSNSLNVSVEKFLPGKYVLLFGVLNRQLAKMYKATGARVCYLSLSEEEDTVMRSQGLGLSIFRCELGHPPNPAIADGNTGLVVLGRYADEHATVEQRAQFARGIAPIVEE